MRRRSPQERWEYEEEGVPLLRRVLSWVDVLCCSTCMTFGAGVFYCILLIIINSIFNYFKIFVITGFVAKSIAGPAGWLLVTLSLFNEFAHISAVVLSLFLAGVAALISSLSYR